MRGLSPARLGRIALREYLSYVRTVGFWLSLLLMPLGLVLAASLPALLERSAPEVRATIVDLTGLGYAPRIEAALEARERRDAEAARRSAAAAGLDSPPAPARPPFVLVAPPTEALQARDAQEAARRLAPYLAGQRPGPGGRINAAAVIRQAADGRPALDYWTAEVPDALAENRIAAALREVVRADDLRAVGVDPGQLEIVERAELEVRTFSPEAASGSEVSDSDRLPSIVGFAMGMLLWSVVLTGAGILLNSVIEEKSSRILEVLLASAGTTEIMGGKIAGVAMVTLTVMAVWAGLGGLALLGGAPELAGDLVEVLIGRGYLAYFALYLVGGYLMYAAAFAALGAFCETTREAQTLLGPVMLLLTVPVLFMGLAIRNPDAELLRILSWIPPFTPFIMAARAGGEPPWWEIAGTATVMAGTVAAVLWLSGRAFRAGALSTVKLEPKAIWAALRGR